MLRVVCLDNVQQAVNFLGFNVHGKVKEPDCASVSFVYETGSNVASHGSNVQLKVSFVQDAVKIMARDLVRTRRQVKKFILMRANIQAVSLKIQTLRSQNAMAQAMRGVTRAMQNMNRQVSV